MQSEFDQVSSMLTDEQAMLENIVQHLTQVYGSGFRLIQAFTKLPDDSSVLDKAYYKHFCRVNGSVTANQLVKVKVRYRDTLYTVQATYCPLEQRVFYSIHDVEKVDLKDEYRYYVADSKERSVEFVDYNTFVAHQFHSEFEVFESDLNGQVMDIKVLEEATDFTVFEELHRIGAEKRRNEQGYGGVEDTSDMTDDDFDALLMG